MKLNATHSERFVLEYQLTGQRKAATAKFTHCGDALRFLLPMDWIRMTVTVEAELMDGTAYRQLLFSAMQSDKRILPTAALTKARQLFAELN
jgi:hypothetical protein